MPVVCGAAEFGSDPVQSKYEAITANNNLIVLACIHFNSYVWSSC